MVNPRYHNVKREKKKSLYMREITSLIQEIAQDEPVVAQVYVTRVDFSADCGICYVYFSTFGEFSEELFEQVLERLKLYRPSMRSALARSIKSRYTPDLAFFYDKTKEKEFKINQLLDKVVEDLRENEQQDEHD